MASCSQNVRQPRIVLIGDSTVAEYPSSLAPMAGWGQALRVRLRGRKEVLNLARPGYGTRRYAAEQWPRTLARLAAQDIVLIQFGHIDGLPDPERHTEPDGEYKESLHRFVADTLAVGAKPGLVTPIPRHQFFEGKVLDPLPPYAEVVRKVALASGILLIDLAAMGTTAMEAMGESASQAWFMKAHDGNDSLHLSLLGADWFAAIIESRLESARVI
jgi:lysophospholipase L1-like esterase